MTISMNAESQMIKSASLHMHVIPIWWKLNVQLW